MDLTQYWFMLPVSVMVATSAMLCGIGGAALFTPIFILVFPLIGPEYVLESTVAAIGTALLTETFGFSSGFVGYYRKKTIDFELAVRLLRVAVPVAIVGAFSAHFFPDWSLIGGYALLVFALAIVLVFLHHESLPRLATPKEQRRMRRKVDSHGREYVYPHVELGPMSGVTTAVGAFLTGIVSVGIGEVVVPQLTKRGIPVAVAAATSVAVVIVTAACASFTLIGQIISEGGMDAVPWNLVMYTIPGVIIGGQIGPRLQGLVEQRTMEKAIGVVFLVIAIAMFGVAWTRFVA